MGNKESTAKPPPKDAVDRHDPNVQMVQNIFLIWLDSSINENAPDCQKTIGQLRRAMNPVQVFTDAETCIEFLKTITNDKTCMIISGALGERIVPQIHDLVQVDTIFLFCGNKAYHEIWVKNWSKIKGVFTEIAPICAALKLTAHQCEQDSIPISFVDANVTTSKNQIEPSFMYTTILKEILLTIKFEEQHVQEYIEYCQKVFASDVKELENINIFEREHTEKSAVWWYTYDCFLYRMLNRALRLLDVDIIIKMGFFISDLHRQIDELHKQQLVAGQFNRSFTVYRGQGMTETEFNKLQQMKGGLLSFNNFLSTSKQYDISIGFTRNGAKNPENIGILFVITVRPDQSTTPFASVAHISQYKEDEVLFSMHSIFRINDIKPMKDNERIFMVDLTLTADNDKDLQTLMNRIRDESFPDAEGWYRLGEMLRKMGHFEKAQHVYEMLLNQETVESKKASIYQQLGIMYYEQGQHKRAALFYEKNLAITQKLLSPNDPHLAVLYNNIGAVYDGIGDYTSALSYYKKALENQQQSLPPDHPDLAMSYNNIGWTYKNMHQYSQALASYQKALEIQQKSLHPNHPELGMSYNNIGEVYCYMDDTAKALSLHEKALAIWRQSLSPDHPYFAESYNNFGLVYERISDFSRASTFFGKAIDIAQKTSSTNHPDLQKWMDNFDRVKTKM